ncbi:MAG: hypothetical protein BA861_03880 [Desulfobacterales bacterium S3730MH5]|nr:MAG: hypothetical protein BA861_03880 [Desulfobacterales bacterium S3730MH5]OEU79498.1 MAG: hypothetical protein BA865_03695 [Desulfobacterales bacterium S5133MH4]
MDKALIFVVDDDASTRRLLRHWLEKEGYRVLDFESGEECLRMMDREPSAICLDIVMHGMDGIEVLKRIKKINSDVPVIMITAEDTVDTAVEAMREGAYDYMVKPTDKVRFKTTVKRSLENYALIAEVKRIRRELKKKYEFENIIGKSRSVQRLFDQIDKVLNTNITVLIEGETGTGKELVAKAIHYNSNRKRGPFVDINCGAIPENLQESEFFGFEKGAFTGATHAKKGKLETAHEGTLFLDEISDMGKQTQVKLLRFLQEKNFERIGGRKKIEVSVRIISATNRMLKDAVKEGDFREDLYYRLAVYPIYVPPLRERKDDIPILATHFLKKYQDETSKEINTISNEAMEALTIYRWPGNVRELENTIYRAMVSADSDIIDINCLPEALQEERLIEVDSQKIIRLSDIEKKALVNALKATEGNITQAAKALNIGRNTLYRKLLRYQLHKTYPELTKSMSKAKNRGMSE